MVSIIPVATWPPSSTTILGQFLANKSQSEVFELRVFAKKGQRFRWNLGAFYFNEDQQVGYLALADRGYCCYSGTEFTMPDVRGKSHAFYADGTYDVADRLRVLGGIRYTEESKSRYGIGGNWALTLGGADYACCIATRLGTEGFVPALLSRPNFDVSKINTPQGMAQFLIQGIASPGARDTLINQIGAIANGTNPAGTCFTRPDIDNGFVTCPTNTNGGFSYANLTIPGQQVGSAAFKYADWRLGFEFDLSTGHMVYGKVSTGHKAGGFNDSFNGSTVPETYRPEKLIVYEVGSRNTFDVMGRRAVFNLTGFYYDYKDQVFQDLTCINLDTTQTPNVCNGYSLVNRNIGASRCSVPRRNSAWRCPTTFARRECGLPRYPHHEWRSGRRSRARQRRGWQVAADQPGGQPVAAGLQGQRQRACRAVDRSGSWPVRLAGSGQLPLGLLSDAVNNKDVVFLNGTRQSALTAGFPDRQPGFVTLNLGAGYQVKNLRIEVWASNLLDVQASQKELAGSALNIRFLNDARSYGARIRYSF
jgi:iron complex outermembrane receptor protein